MKINLSKTEILELEKKGWKVGPEVLSKKFTFPKYAKTIEFTNSIFIIAESQNHHPDLLIKYGSVEISISNHDENCISKKCYDFATEVESKNS